MIFIKKRSLVLVYCLNESYLRCFYLCFKVYCFDESYLRCFWLCFCLCFKCLKCFDKRKIKAVLITWISTLLNYYTTKPKSTVIVLLSLIIIIDLDHFYYNWSLLFLSSLISIFIIIDLYFYYRWSLLLLVIIIFTLMPYFYNLYENKLKY